MYPKYNLHLLHAYRYHTLTAFGIEWMERSTIKFEHPYRANSTQQRQMQFRMKIVRIARQRRRENKSGVPGEKGRKISDFLEAVVVPRLRSPLSFNLSSFHSISSFSPRPSICLVLQTSRSIIPRLPCNEISRSSRIRWYTPMMLILPSPLSGTVFLSISFSFLFSSPLFVYACSVYVRNTPERTVIT